LFFDAMQCRWLTQSHSLPASTYQVCTQVTFCLPSPVIFLNLGGFNSYISQRQQAPLSISHHTPLLAYLALEMQPPRGASAVLEGSMMATGGHVRVYNVVCRDGGGAEATTCCIDVFASQSLILWPASSAFRTHFPSFKCRFQASIRNLETSSRLLEQIHCTRQARPQAHRPAALGSGTIGRSY